MQKRYAAAIALAVAIAAPFHAQAAQIASNTGTVCGRIEAPAMTILRLEQMPVPGNIVVARSASDEVRTTVNIDGSYCFSGLHDRLYTITAFDEGLPQYTASVTPQNGKTVVLDLFASAE